MKSFTRLILFTIIICGASLKADAQVQYSRKYKVVAYKKGDLSVFSESNEVEIIPAMSLYIPGCFTPNGDGLNDTFGVAGEAVKDFKMQIFNRWGQMIFESENANFRWDGTFHGEKVPEGGYVYRVYASSPAGIKETKEGSLMVVM